MVICEQHRYLFVEVPNTACTAIAAELVENYGGRKLLRKHARLEEAEAELGAEKVAALFKVCGVRNPLDVWVTRYLKLKSDHRGNFTNPAKHQRKGGWVPRRKMRQFRLIRDQDASFSEYIQAFPESIGVDMQAVDRCDMVIRYESLADGFAEFLRRVDLAPVRPLPVVNPTAGKRDYRTYYDAAALEVARARLEEPMARLGYGFPDVDAAAGTPR